jgi:predicted  nucleic acid-binding Zn-ribbon protein
MQSDLLQLVRLQDLMQEVEAHSTKIAAMPAAVARLEKELLAVQAEVEKERAELEELQKDRRKLEGELMAVEDRVKKFQSQLSEVKTNKEYQAVLKEIETCRVEREGLDEKILLEMEQADGHNEAFRLVEQKLKARRDETEAGKRRLSGETETLKLETARLDKEREALASTIPASHLDPFMKIAGQKRGIALVPVRDELCGGCHVRVMPTLIQQVRRAERLISCDSCRRFMYVPEDAVASAPTPAAEPPPK